VEFLTKLEELILLSVWQLGDEAYGTTIYRHIRTTTGKNVSLGGVYFPLDRLAKRGCLRVYHASATPDRRGQARRYYRLTETGLTVLDETRRINELFWAGYPVPAPAAGRAQ
jgi:PadR family transcriptional regulator PadR